ncbi:MAG: RnfABCDGE type electron transport complex subunit G [Clostridiales bacterium]|nr:RnfABCDGE type electron transport complex subunit G [Clostridiales bacterium]
MSRKKEKSNLIENKKKTADNEIIRLGVTLFAITFVVALLLGITNMFTKDRIAAAKEQSAIDAMKLVQPEADEFNPIDVKLDDAVVSSVNEAKKGGEVVGWCVKASPNGYGGTIELMVGISKDKAVTGVSIISLSETPGLGAKASEKSFIDQYVSKTGPLNVVKGSAADQNDILAISGATITSKAVTSGVQAALDCITKLQDEGVLK